MLKPRSRAQVCVMGLLIAAATICASEAAEQNAPYTRLNAVPGASLVGLLSALANANNGVVVADVERHPRTLQEALSNATLDDALSTVAADFDRHWVRRGRSIALQLRRSDPEEPPGAELEELRLATADLERLLSLIPRFDSMPQERVKTEVALVNSLTPKQREHLQAGPLPFAQLSAEQQRTLVGVGLSVIYGAAVRRVHNTNQVLLSLPHASVRIDRFGPAPLPPDVEIPPDRGLVARSFISARVPEPVSLSGEAAVRVEVLAAGLAGEDQKRVLTASGTHLAAPNRRRADRWVLPAQGMSLSDLAVSYRRLTGRALRVPSYARERRFWVCSVGGDRLDVLQAVADLWGWESSATSQGRQLGRPFQGPGRDAADLHARVPQALPPYLWHATTRYAKRLDIRRRMVDLRRVDAELRRLAQPGASVTGGQLSLDSQWRLTSSMLEMATLQWRTATDDFRGVPSFLADPAGTVLRFESRVPVPAGDTPILWFEDSNTGFGFPARTEVPPLPTPRK